ncbi:carboxylesterase family protein [Gaetbulibacter saemankumensis]|uniref:carboxylesterase family protein n=1 Tax=Gaetbulibacter saemankumensis TaxID=311208 RepID=UPI00040470CF|nr:dienelactone hydrolase family protein [Gaetbulibacter saemankumensis]
MKNSFLLICVFSIFSIISFSCNRDIFDDTNISTEPPKPRTADHVRNDFKNLEITPGTNDFTIETTTKGVFWNFRIIAPENASITNKKPLIFNLHGGARNIAPEAHKSTACLIEPATNNTLDAFIISPNSNGSLWFDQPNQIQILALYDLATSNLPIDTSKVAITGYSDGGNGSWFYAQFHSNLFSAAIPMATSYNTANSDGTIDKIKIPLYVVHGENDQLFPLANTQNFVNASINSGSNITFVVANNLDHYSVCDYLPYLKDGIDWLINDVWQY